MQRQRSDSFGRRGLRRRGKGIEEIIREESEKGGVSSEEVMKGSRGRQVSRARVEIMQFRCKEELGFSGAEIARHLGVNTTSINRALGKRNTSQGPRSIIALKASTSPRPFT